MRYAFILTNFLTQPAGMRIERRGRLRNLQGDFMHMYLRSDVIHVCIACGRSAKSGEEGLRPDLPEGGKSRCMYLKGVEGTILVVPRWAVPDRPPASWYRARLSAGASIDVSALGEHVDSRPHVILACYSMIVAVIPRLTWSGARTITSGGLCALE